MHAAATSPVAWLIEGVLPRMGGATETGHFFNDERRRSVIKGIFDSYYSDVGAEMIFDTNRTWTAKAPLLREIYPDCRIICCVREVGWIINSIEQMLRKNPLQLSRVFAFSDGGTVYTRADMLMDPRIGLVGLALAQLRELWHGDLPMIIVNYDTLAGDPRGVMKRLYEELDEPLFDHDYDNVTYDDPGYDALLGMPGLHKVHGKVEPRHRSPCIPPSIFEKYADNFWLSDRRGAVIL